MIEINEQTTTKVKYTNDNFWRTYKRNWKDYV